MALVRHIGIALCALALVLGAAVLWHNRAAAPTPMQTTVSTRTLHVGGAVVVAEIADTESTRQLGLGNRVSLKEGTGMWFVFEKDGIWPFWMKDTLIPLDIIWVSADGTIVTIARNVEPKTYPKAFYPAEPARYALEVPAGYCAKMGIAEGQIVHVE